jgi:hypothetical protein
MGNRKITLRPAADERLVVPESSGRTTERVFIVELAQYLHHRVGVVRRFARRHGLLRSQRLANRRLVDWVSPYGAQRIIAYVRAIQGCAYLQGHQFHELRERWAADNKRLAISRAEADDERQRSACATSVAETAVVSPVT